MSLPLTGGVFLSRYRYTHGVPELPEVTTIVRELQATVRGKIIRDVSVDAPKLIRPLTTPQFRAAVRGKTFLGFTRRAKFVIASLGTSPRGRVPSSKLPITGYILWHMGMTGHPLFRDPQVEASNRKRRAAMADPINGHIRLSFFFTDGTRLAYSDVRKFGKVEFVQMSNPLEHPQLRKLGPEVLELVEDVATFGGRLKARKKAVKVALLDQAVLAGIGNIYADEALWTARIHPLLPTRRLTAARCRRLAYGLSTVLYAAIRAHGTSIDDYRRLSGIRGHYGNLLEAYQRTGLPCRRCGTLIQRLVVGGRGTHICPRCQRR